MRYVCSASRRYLLLLLLPIAAGCGSEYGSALEVSGTATLDGQPLAATQVIFHADSGLPAAIRTVTTTTDDAGRYVLPEVYPATYTVAFSRLAPEAYAETDQPLANVEDDQLARWAPQNSDLQVEVSAEKTTHNFDLKTPSAQ